MSPIHNHQSIIINPPPTRTVLSQVLLSLPLSLELDPARMRDSAERVRLGLGSGWLGLGLGLASRGGPSVSRPDPCERKGEKGAPLCICVCVV